METKGYINIRHLFNEHISTLDFSTDTGEGIKCGAARRKKENRHSWIGGESELHVKKNLYNSMEVLAIKRNHGMREVLGRELGGLGERRKIIAEFRNIKTNPQRWHVHRVKE